MVTRHGAPLLWKTQVPLRELRKSWWQRAAVNTALLNLLLLTQREESFGGQGGPSALSPMQEAPVGSRFGWVLSSPFNFPVGVAEHLHSPMCKPGMF